MKTILLVLLIMPFGFAVAQNNSVAKTAAVNDVLIGTSENGYTVQGFRGALDCNPQINTISFIHRANATVGVGNNSGELFFDVSKDGGLTWSINQGPLYNDPAGFNGARFPNAVIYNPSGNTNPNNAFLTYYAPVSQNNNFTQDVFGTGNFGATFSSTQNINTQPYAGGTDLTVPDGMIITQQGETYVCDARLPSATFGSYDGTLQLRHGIWNGSNNMNYTTDFLSMPVDHDNNGNANYAGKCGVAFDNTGLVGYAWINGHYDFTLAPDSAYYLGIKKTTDGGVTWGSTRYITFNGTGSGTINNLLGGGGNGIYSTWNESDGVVDKNGNLHIVCAIAPLAGAFSINITPGQWGLFDVYTTDGGSTWKGELLDKPETFEAIFPSTTSFITETNRAQVAKTWTGDKLFFGWMDTDTLAFGTYDNLNPDIHLRALNVNTGQWTLATNATASLPQTYGECTFLNISPYVMSAAGTYTIPCTYTKILTHIGAPVEHHYLDGILVADADFSVNSNPANLNSYLVGLNEIDASTLSSITIYPNPSTDASTLVIDLKNSATVNVEIKNILGALIQQQNIGELSYGQHKVDIDTHTLPVGIYMLSVLINDQAVTKKLVINR